MLNDAHAVALGVEEDPIRDEGGLGTDSMAVEATDFGEEEVGSRHSGSIDGGGVAFQGVAGDEGLDGVLGGAHSFCEVA